MKTVTFPLPLSHKGMNCLWVHAVLLQKQFLVDFEMLLLDL